MINTLTESLSLTILTRVKEIHSAKTDVGDGRRVVVFTCG